MPLKRSLYDSEYDKIRRAAGYARPNYEFPDVAEEQLSQERVEAANADFRQRMDDLAAAERRLDAEKRVKFDRWREQKKLSMIRREYTDLGIVPPEPLVSLQLLRQLGWRTEQVGIAGRWTLIRPLHIAPPVIETLPNEMGS